MGRAGFYIRALSFLLFAVFGAAAVIESNSSHPDRAVAFGIAAGAFFVIGIAVKWLVRVQAIARLLGGPRP